ncbi:AAA family ATPase [Solirubrobacter ginsenosidimutans]|uniref:AAA family ATPase n=1 Tax=Solirubrobacter ginsenosidimutans TaxID=490573 RepID=A0A9X3S5R7_9ACTN|nr:AAA family ATPase [Solirubrobacter ginsenosidimutans]MDA0167084.1 AAA family ATPase [Solirubrobacter ginsenosidimutans]
MASERIARQVESLLENARWAVDAGDHEQSRAFATAVLALDPGNAQAQALLEGSARRCQMTMMFCDMVGSTALSQELDPEDLTEVLREYRSICAGAVEHYGGFIEDRQGDGLLVRFGYPNPHEDDARRGVLSGLEIVREIRRRGPALRRALGVDLHVRIALHTGMVVIDDGGIVGAAPNEAARLQSLADPDVVLISETTQALVEGYFDVEARGRAELRGVPVPVGTYVVTRERASARLSAAASLTPFTGREPELDVMAAAWRDAGEGAAAAAIMLSGGAGIGKSRLIMEAAQRLRAECLLCPCSGYHQTTSLHAFRGVLERVCGIEHEDGPAERLAKLRAAAGDGGDLPLLATALSIPLDAIEPPAEMEPGKLRELALQAAVGLVQSHVAAGAAMLVIEDLHWADETTLDLIGVLLRRPRRGLLVVLTAREQFQPPWPDELVRRVELNPLSRPELETMAEGVQDCGLAGERLAELIDRSDGIPLYLEELIRSFDARDPRALSRSIHEPDPRIPAALRDSLLARLASPGVDLPLAQIAATIGRDVDRGLLQRVAGLPDEAFQAKLANLLAARLFEHSGARTVRFRHELIRVVAYETQRRSAAGERHSRIADLLGTVDLPASRDAGRAAFHLEKAHRYDEAIAAYIAAARAGQELGAHKEATTDLTHALALVEHLPEGPRRLVTELTVRQLRSFSAVMAGGFSAPESKEDHARSATLCAALGSGPEMLPSLLVGWTYYCSAGDLAGADEVSDSVEEVVATSGLDIPAREICKGVSRFFQGRFEEARELMERFLEHPWAIPEGRLPAEWPMPNDPYVSIAAHLLATEWIVGRPEAALAIAEPALRRCAGLSFPFGAFSSGYIHSQLVLLYRLDGDHDAAQKHVREMLTLGERHGFSLWLLVGSIQDLMTRVHRGDRLALDGAVQGLRVWRQQLASEAWSPYFLTELAIAQTRAGERAAAVATLDEALEVAAQTGSQFFTAETLRLRGTLRHELGHPGGLADLQQAVRTAQHQGATAFHARALDALGAARPLVAP